MCTDLSFAAKVGQGLGFGTLEVSMINSVIQSPKVKYNIFNIYLFVNVLVVDSLNKPEVTHSSVKHSAGGTVNMCT